MLTHIPSYKATSLRQGQEACSVGLSMQKVEEWALDRQIECNRWWVWDNLWIWAITWIKIWHLVGGPFHYLKVITYGVIKTLLELGILKMLKEIQKLLPRHQTMTLIISILNLRGVTTHILLREAVGRSNHHLWELLATLKVTRCFKDLYQPGLQLNLVASK